MDKFRFFTLLESKTGNLKPLISENKLKEEGFLQKKDELFNFLYEYGLNTDAETEEIDINKDGEMDSELVTFEKGNVQLYLGICNFSNGDLKYLCHIKTKPDYNVVLEPTFVDNLDELKDKILPYIEKSYEDTKLNYLGIDKTNEYQLSKNEYNDLINQAIDSENWEEVSRLQKEYDKFFN